MKKIYLLVMASIFIIGIAAQDKNILVVHNGTTSNQHVSSIITAIKATDGLSVDTVDINDVALLATKVDEADAVVITEVTNSNTTAENYTGYVTKPTICLKTYALLLRKNGWDWLDDEAEEPSLQWIATHDDNPDNADVPGVSEIEILEDHLIFAGIGGIGDKFSFATAVVEGQETEAHYQTIDLSASTTNDDIAFHSTPIGRSTWAEANGASSLNDILWVVEENNSSKNAVVFGIHSTYILSPEGLLVITNSIKWSLGLMSGVEKVSASSKFAMYPNPLSEVLTINNTASINNVEIVDITGKVIIDHANNGLSTIHINTSNFVKGLYLVRINTVEGLTYTDKLVK